MAEIQSSSTGLSGEYFVAAELLRRGYSVGITMGNAKAIDILAEKDGKLFIIQVKAIFKKKNVGWCSCCMLYYQVFEIHLGIRTLPLHQGNRQGIFLARVLKKWPT